MFHNNLLLPFLFSLIPLSNPVLIILLPSVLDLKTIKQKRIIYMQPSTYHYSSISFVLDNRRIRYVELTWPNSGWQNYSSTVSTKSSSSISNVLHALFYLLPFSGLASFFSCYFSTKLNEFKTKWSPRKKNETNPYLPLPCFIGLQVKDFIYND